MLRMNSLKIAKRMILLLDKHLPPSISILSMIHNLIVIVVVIQGNCNIVNSARMRMTFVTNVLVLCNVFLTELNIIINILHLATRWQL